ncbi:hypothetical protein D3C75_1164300 [compost metagenome]
MAVRPAQVVGHHRQRRQAVVGEDAMDCVVQAVADDAQWQAQRLRAIDEGGEARIDPYLVQVCIEGGRIQLQQADLALHAFTRADLTRPPLIFQLLPAWLAELFQQ